MDTNITIIGSIASKDTELPQALNLKLLMEVLDEEFTKNKTIEGNVARITKILESYRSIPQDWKEYALFDPTKYTRNLVDDGNGRYSLVIQCWGPGQESQIQDHSLGHCIMKILHGELYETVYEMPNALQISQSEPLIVKKEQLHSFNSVSHISNRIGLQKISNKSAIPAVSIHLYSPIVTDLQSYSPKTSRPKPLPKFQLHSKYGELTHRQAKRFTINPNLTSMHNNYYSAAAPSVVPPVVGNRIQRSPLLS